MAETTTIWVTGAETFRRGRYEYFAGWGKVRVTHVSETTLTVRLYAGRWLEPINRRIEDWLLFPLADGWRLVRNALVKLFQLQ